MNSYSGILYMDSKVLICILYLHEYIEFDNWYYVLRWTFFTFIDGRSFNQPLANLIFHQCASLAELDFCSSFKVKFCFRFASWYLIFRPFSSSLGVRCPYHSNLRDFTGLNSDLSPACLNCHSIRHQPDLSSLCLLFHSCRELARTFGYYRPSTPILTFVD